MVDRASIKFGMAPFGTVRFNTLRPRAVQILHGMASTVRCGVTRYGAMRYGTACGGRGAARCAAIRSNTAWRAMASYGIARRRALQCSTVRHATTGREA